VMQMDEGTQQNAALVEEATAAARSMEQQAAHLAQTVAVFRVQVEAAQRPVASVPHVVPAPPRPARPAPAAVPRPRPPRATATAAIAAAEASGEWQEF